MSDDLMTDENMFMDGIHLMFLDGFFFFWGCTIPSYSCE